MRYNHTLTVTVNAPDTIGCTPVDGEYVRREVQQLVQERARRTNHDYDSNVSVVSVTVESAEAEADAAPATGGVFQPLAVDDVTDETIANAINTLGETVARLAALAERAERYLGR